MQGGTFTISSIGGIGGTAFTQIVNAPEVAILGATRTSMKPVWDGKQFVPRLMLPISVSYDHRVVDGAGAARFLVYIAELLADFRRAMLRFRFRGSAVRALLQRAGRERGAPLAIAGL